MVLHFIRAMFALVMAAVGWFYLTQPAQFAGSYHWLVFPIALAIGVFVLFVDVLSPRKKLGVLAGAFFGLLVGAFISYALSFVVHMVVYQQYQPPAAIEALSAGALPDNPDAPGNQRQVAVATYLIEFRQRQAALEGYINLIIGVITCYLSISFVLQTKDDFRFIIPYVEFRKQTKGARPMLLDTSVLIDGRISDIATTGVLESQLIVPRFVLEELQAVADSGDKLKRNRGRRGLDVLAELQASSRVEVVLYDSELPQEDDEQDSVPDVDQRLLNLAKLLGSRVLTNDLNLNKVAQLRGVEVVNINDLANALKPVVLPGEKMTVRLVKPGEEAGQGIGYLADGTMVVVEQGRSHINEEVALTVTSMLQTSAGRMIFGRLDGDNHGSPPSVSSASSAASSSPSRRSRGRSDAPPDQRN